MGFLENASAEMLGGIMGGLVVLVFLSAWNKIRLFEIRCFSPSELITAEHIQTCTALRTNVGCCTARLRIRPRRGMELEQYDFAFFDRGWLPWLVGRRRNTPEVRVLNMRYVSDNSRVFHDSGLRVIEGEGSHSGTPMVSLAAGNCLYLEIDICVAETLKMWEGVLSLQLHYQRDGNPERQNVRMKFFVRPPDARRPWRSMFKRVMNCEAKPPGESEHLRKGSQP